MNDIFNNYDVLKDGEKMFKMLDETTKRRLKDLNVTQVGRKFIKNMKNPPANNYEMGFENVKEQDKINQKMMDYWLEHGKLPTEGKGKNSKYRRPFMPEEWKQQVKAKIANTEGLSCPRN